MITKKFVDKITYVVNSCAIEVHKTLGPGLLESIYHKCLLKEFELNTVSYKSELIIPIEYKGLNLFSEIRCDIFVESLIVIELKAVESVLPIHEAQLFTYMKLLKAPKGIMYILILKI